MPEADAGSGSSGEMPSADKLEPSVKGKERQQYSSRPSSSTSELDAPYPFDSQSALDAENGKRCMFGPGYRPSNVLHTVQ